MTPLEDVINYLEELKEDSNLPKNVKSKLGDIGKSLKSATKETLSLTINKLLSDLDDISSDSNLDAFTRQQIWSISSMLESVETE